MVKNLILINFFTVKVSGCNVIRIFGAKKQRKAILQKNKGKLFWNLPFRSEIVSLILAANS
jgi:hypothetical protein